MLRLAHRALNLNRLQKLHFPWLAECKRSPPLCKRGIYLIKSPLTPLFQRGGLNAYGRVASMSGLIVNPDQFGWKKVFGVSFSSNRTCKAAIMHKKQSLGIRFRTNEAPPQTNESWVGSIIGKLWLSPHWLTLREDAHVIPVNRTHERTLMYVTLSRFNPPAPIPGTIRKWCNSRLFLGKLLFLWGKGYFCPSF